MARIHVILKGCLVMLVALTAHASPGADEATTAPGGADRPSIFIERQTGCVDEAALTKSLRQALDMHRGARHMMVAVVIAPAVYGSVVSLRVVMTRTGEIVLDRQLKLAQADCANAHQFIKLMLEQFLTEFTIDDWIRKNVPEELASARPVGVQRPRLDEGETTVNANQRLLRWLLLFSLDGRLPSPSGDVDLGAGIDVGSTRHGFTTGLGARLGYPHALDEGRYLETGFLFNAGWRYAPTSKLDLRTEIRIGPLLIDSFGYEIRYQHVLLWLEAQVSFAWQIGPIHLGPLVGVSPLRHSVSTIAGTGRDIPWVRVGILLAAPLLETGLK